MNTQNRTLIRTIATIFVFLAFTGFLVVLAIMLTVFGIVLAFDSFIKGDMIPVGLILMVVLAIYATALSIGCEIIERKI